MKRIRVFFLTGIRSEYDLLYPVIYRMNQDPSFDVSVIVCGAHLTELHNNSYKQIENDGFRIVEKIESLLYSESELGKAKSAAILMQALTQTLAREMPDYLVVLGDREEVIVGSLVSTYLGIPVVHIAGGDHTLPVLGDVDEAVRHAATKLSHVHLTMAEAHSERITRMGEEPWRVFTVGNPGIDRLRMEQGASLDDLAEVLGPLVRSKYVILIHHPLSSAIQESTEEIRSCLEICIQKNIPVFVGSPNSDPGFQRVRDVIHQFSANDNVIVYNNLPRNLFVSLLRNAHVLLGNSSLALHEAGYLGLPSINVGERQRGRLAGNNVQFISSDTDEIRAALDKAVFDENYRAGITKHSSVYGDGYMADRTLEIFKKLPGKQVLLAKKNTY
ncbi:UDP-N-acetylglucosamine 2-epimerase [Paenibacillus sp. GCM10027628]|uniref:UDP-N-acetylglucosamine 2-epimerase n=1 Tax=Paenibacillus sp. GCM10027628 TaxID=3273413 RepID=UPI00362B35AF